MSVEQFLSIKEKQGNNKRQKCNIVRHVLYKSNSDTDEYLTIDIYILSNYALMAIYMS